MLSKIEQMKKIIDDLQSEKPGEWILISPEGKIWMHENPMVAAARATPSSLNLWEDKGIDLRVNEYCQTRSRG